MPIQVGVIEEKLNPLLLTFFCQHFKHILLVGSAIHYVIVRHLGIEHAKAIMMFAGNGDVFHSRRFGQGNPFGGIELGRIELGGQIFVL